jgi:hypothetical protein
MTSWRCHASCLVSSALHQSCHTANVFYVFLCMYLVVADAELLLRDTSAYVELCF